MYCVYKILSIIWGYNCIKFKHPPPKKKSGLSRLKKTRLLYPNIRKV